MIHMFGVYLLMSDFLKVLKPTKTIKKDHSFYNTVSLKKPHSIYEPQLAQHCKKYTPTAQPKILPTLQIFQETGFWLVLQKTFVLHHFKTPKNCIFDALTVKKFHRCKNYQAIF